jgi:hypothetical protein
MLTPMHGSLYMDLIAQSVTDPSHDNSTGSLYIDRVAQLVTNPPSASTSLSLPWHFLRADLLVLKSLTKYTQDHNCKKNTFLLTLYPYLFVWDISFPGHCLEVMTELTIAFPL